MDAELTDVTELIARARSGRPRAVARLISMIENDAPQRRALSAQLAPSTGSAQVIGLTGPPGVGKSTTTAALVAAFRALDQRVGVLALDPSSPFTGGALLGDRVRMQQHTLDGEVFIRSMASRGQLGGLSVAAPQVLRVFDAIGCDPVLVETVGVGQSEVDIAATADTTVVLLAPGMGDGVQAAKAGILEIGDVFVVNKSDRDGAQPLLRELRSMIAMTPRGPEAWKPPIISTVASTGAGIDDLCAALGRHQQHTDADGTRERRRLARARTEIESLALATVRQRIARQAGSTLDGVAAGVRGGELDPYAASEQVIRAVLFGAPPS